MTFLLMDTGGAMCVLALAEEGTGSVRAVTVFEGRRTLSRRVMGAIDALLASDSMTLADVTAFAVGIGPGSFTGVRVGVTTARTLAQVTGKPLVGIGTLDAYAEVWQGAGTLVPVLPSRRGEAYAAIYVNGACAEPPFAASFDVLTDRLRSLPDAIVCGDASLLPGWTGRCFTQPWTPPEGVARLAARRLAAGDTDDPLSLPPLYVVPPSISTPKNLAILPPSVSPPAPAD